MPPFSSFRGKSFVSFILVFLCHQKPFSYFFLIQQIFWESLWSLLRSHVMLLGQNMSVILLRFIPFFFWNWVMTLFFCWLPLLALFMTSGQFGSILFHDYSDVSLDTFQGDTLWLLYLCYHLLLDCKKDCTAGVFPLFPVLLPRASWCRWLNWPSCKKQAVVDCSFFQSLCLFSLFSQE